MQCGPSQCNASGLLQNSFAKQEISEYYTLLSLSEINYGSELFWIISPPSLSMGAMRASSNGLLFNVRQSSADFIPSGLIARYKDAVRAGKKKVNYYSEEMIEV